MFPDDWCASVVTACVLGGWAYSFRPASASYGPTGTVGARWRDRNNSRKRVSLRLLLILSRLRRRSSAEASSAATRLRSRYDGGSRFACRALVYLSS